MIIVKNNDKITRKLQTFFNEKKPYFFPIAERQKKCKPKNVAKLQEYKYKKKERQK